MFFNIRFSVCTCISHLYIRKEIYIMWTGFSVLLPNLNIERITLLRRAYLTDAILIESLCIFLGSSSSSSIPRECYHAIRIDFKALFLEWTFSISLTLLAQTKCN